MILFRGDELKIGRRHKAPNKLKYTIERDGSGFFELLEEWLTVWQPCLMKYHNVYAHTPKGRLQIERAELASRDILHMADDVLPADAVEPDNGYVFLNSNGMPWTRFSIYVAFTKTAYRYLRVPLTPHLVRDCWATEYLVRTREEFGSPDVVGAAVMLGDSLQAVQEHYAHILGEEAQARPKQWLQRYLGYAQQSLTIKPENKH